MATSQRKLQTIFGFTDTDLNANRKGRLSAAQIKELQHQSVYELKMLLGIPAVLASSSMLMLDLKIALPVMMVMLAIAGGLVALHREHLKTFRDKQVQKLAGQLIKHPLTNGSIQYIVSVAGRHLPVERGVYEELSDGYFAVYILEDSHHILSIEPIAKSTVKAPDKIAVKLPTKTPAKTPAKTPVRTTKTKPTPVVTGANPTKSAKPVVKAPVKATATKSVKATALPPKAKPAKPKGVVKPQPPAAIGRSRSS